MPHISLRNLGISYGKHAALRGVSVDIPDRQITAIIGPSGCGKTTLLKSLNRLTDLYPEVEVRGEVLIDGVNIYAPGADVLALRKKVGFLPQKPFPLPMSIYGNVAFGPRIHGVNGAHMRRQREADAPQLAGGHAGRTLAASDPPGAGADMDEMVEHYLRLSGLWDEVKDRLDHPASGLSVGQQQRLALARALAVEPEVILADEPTSALDPISSKLIETQFQRLKRDYTIVVVTHILRQARRVADYVMFLYLGELIEHAPAQQFFSSPRHERTRAYVAGEIS
jgi:phosphate transport system ATP-binding protein